MANCVCGQGLPQLEKENKCNKYLRTGVNILAIPRYDDDGNKNSIDLSTTPVPESVFTDMFNQTDSSKRLHQIWGIKNFSQETSDAVKQSWNDGTSTKIRDGKLSITFTVPETSPLYLCAIGKYECVDPDIYVVDSSGQLVGYGDRDTITTDQKLYPLPVFEWEVKKSPFGTDEAVPMAEVTITFELSMDLCKWIVASSDEIVYDSTKRYEAKAANVTITTAASASTQITATVTKNGEGILGNSQVVSGLDMTPSSDFDVKINNVAETVATITESPAGTYVITFSTSLATSDVVTCNTTATSGYVSNVASKTV